MNLLTKVTEIDVVSSIRLKNRAHAEEWLRKQAIRYKQFKIVPESRYKVDLPYDIFIDDSPLVVELARRRGRVAILYHQPWNAIVVERTNLYRVHNLEATLERIKGLTYK